MEDLLAVRTSFGHRFLGPGPELWRHLWKMDPNTVDPLRSHTHTHTLITNSSLWQHLYIIKYNPG